MHRWEKHRTHPSHGRKAASTYTVATEGGNDPRTRMLTCGVDAVLEKAPPPLRRGKISLHRSLHLKHNFSESSYLLVFLEFLSIKPDFRLFRKLVKLFKEDRKIVLFLWRKDLLLSAKVKKK